MNERAVKTVFSQWSPYAEYTVKQGDSFLAIAGISAVVSTRSETVPSSVQDKKVKKTETVTITYNPAKTDEATLQKAIEKLGYSAEKVPEPAA